MMQMCQVYARRGDMLVAAQAQTVDGLWISYPPFEKLPQDASPEEVGAVVLTALAQTAHDVPTPNFKTDPLPIVPVLALAGVKSWATFVRGTNVVEVRGEGDELTFIPMINRGAREGFDYPDDSAAVRVRDASAEETGRALREALDAAIA